MGRYHFEILDKFQKQGSFGKVLNTLLAKWFIVEDKDDRTYKDILKDFKSQYLTSNIPNLKGTLDDLALIIETKEGKIFSHTEFGPYNPEKDIKVHNLNTHSLEAQKILENAKGILVKNIISHSSPNPNFKLFSELYNYQNKKVFDSFEKLQNNN